ncbi:MAG: prefoldin domain-containing protein [Candidatus Aminicenantales bacterium]
MKVLLSVFVISVTFSIGAGAQTLDDRLRTLEEAQKKLEQTIQEQKKLIQELKAEISRRQSPATQQKTPGLLNPAIGMTVDADAYHSNLSEANLEEVNIPGYLSGVEREFIKGFNLREAEMNLYAPVDPYFNLYTTIPITEKGVELEEAYFVTTSLPAGLQLKGGKFRSSFGRLNAFHPHAWDFVDAPLAYRAFLGEEGLNEAGLQLTYLPRLPVFAVVGIEALQGQNPVLFRSDAGWGIHAFSAFAKASLDFASDHTLLFGASVTGGRTETGTVIPETQFDGRSTLYDVELTYKWKPSKQKSLTIQTEYLFRHQSGDIVEAAGAVLDPLRRSQDGWYIQAVRQWGRWRVGSRFDVLGILRDGYSLSGLGIDFGKHPFRLTAALEFNPTEFSRLRLQYNYDRSARSNKVNNEILIQALFTIGAHAAHPF